MPRIEEYKDGLKQDLLPSEVSEVDGSTIREVLESRFPDFTEFYGTPAIVFLNNEVKLREEWDDKIQESAVVKVKYLPAMFVVPFLAEIGFDAIAAIAFIDSIAIADILMVTSLALSVAGWLFMPKPKIPGATPAPNPFYTLSGQQNAIRPMDPIEVVFGKNNCYPSYAGKPYIYYGYRRISKKEAYTDQYIYQLFCLGKGEFAIDEICIEDTPVRFFGKNVMINWDGPDITNYHNAHDIKIDIIHPGQAYPVANIADESELIVGSGIATLSNAPPLSNFYNANVMTVQEVSSIDLLAPNHPDFTVMGPYIAVPAYERTQFLSIDVVHPRGFAGAEVPIKALFEAQEIDDNGIPIGDWFTVLSYTSGDGWENWSSLVGNTFYSQLPRPMRVQLRAQRTTDWDKTAQVDLVTWGGLRTWLYRDLSEPFTFGDVTMMSVIIKANNQINDNTKSRFNVKCTRRTPVEVSDYGLGSYDPPSRSICAAFAEVVVSQNGAGLSVTDPEGVYRHLDLATLRKLESEFDAEGRYFDFVFNQKSTVWEALTTIARAGRCVPVIVGNRLSMVRDRPKTFPAAIFNADNIVKGSLAWEISKPSLRDYDSVEATYVNASTGLQETVKAYLDGQGLNPDKIDLSGTTDRNVAYREALYVYQQNRHIRQKITFKTGLEGMIPSFGDLISVAFPSFTTSTGGWLVDELTSNIDGFRRYQMSSPYDYDALTETPIMFIRRDDGLSAGPYRCLKPSNVADEEALKFLIDVEVQASVDFVNETGREKVFFQLGENYTFFKKCVLVSSKPSGEETVDIECVNYDPRVYDYDNALAPSGDGPPITDETPPAPAWVSLSLLDDAYFVFTWGPVYNVDTYRVWFSRWDPDTGVNTRMGDKLLVADTFYKAKLSGLGQLTNISFSIETLRGDVFGDSATWTGNLNTELYPPPIVTGAMGMDGIRFAWPNVYSADRYRLIPAVWDIVGDDSISPRGLMSRWQGATFTREFKDAMQSMFPTAPFTRSMSFRLSALKNDDVRPPQSYSEITIDIPPPPAPIVNEPYWSKMDTEDTYVSYTIRWAPPTVSTTQYVAFRVYFSATNPPEIVAENIVYEGDRTDTIVTIDLDADEYHAPRYFMVCSTDGWSEADLNFSAVATIPSYQGEQESTDPGYST